MEKFIGYDYQNLNRQGVRYGQEVHWTDVDGSTSKVVVRNCTSHEQAIDLAFRQAKRTGWTPKRWWQFWRWKDTSNPENILKKVCKRKDFA